MQNSRSHLNLHSWGAFSQKVSHFLCQNKSTTFGFKQKTTNFTALFLHAFELTTRALNKHHKTDPKFVFFFFHFMPPKDNNCCVTGESRDASCSPVFLPKLWEPHCSEKNSTRKRRKNTRFITKNSPRTQRKMSSTATQNSPRTSVNCDQLGYLHPSDPEKLLSRKLCC